MQLLFRKLVGEFPLRGELWVRPARPDKEQACGLTSLVLRSGIEALAQGAGPLEQIVVDAEGTHPTLDEMLAAAVAEMLLAGRQPCAGFQAFARYAELLRQGLRPSELPAEKTLEGLFLAIRNEAGKDLSDAETGRKFQAGWQRLLGRIMQAAEAGQEPFNTPLFDTGSEFAQERAYLARDQEVYRQDVLRGERWRVRLPGGPPQASALVLREPHSLLFKYWSRHDRDVPAGSTYLFLAVDWGAGNWVFSTDPVMRLSLKPLADLLQAAEKAVDAAAATHNPWYDGQNHNHTLVAAPKGGTKLPEQRLLKLVRTWAKGRNANERVLSLSRSHLLVMAASILLALVATFLVMGRFPGTSPTASGKKAAPASLYQVSALANKEPVDRGLVRFREDQESAVFSAEITVQAHGGSNEVVFLVSRPVSQPVKLWTNVAAGALQIPELGLQVNDDKLQQLDLRQAGNERQSDPKDSFYKSGENRLRLSFSNRESKALPVTVRVSWQVNYSFKPDLYLLAIGVSKYKRPEFTLGCAATDAENVVEAFKQQEGRLFGKVIYKCLTNEAADKDGVLNGLFWLHENAGPQSLVVVTISGHGTRGLNDRFFFLPHDYSPDKKLAATAVSWQDFEEPLGAMECPVIVVMDTCHSGAIKLARGFRGEDPEIDLDKAITEAVQNLRKMKSGMVVMAACMNDQRAKENSDWQHGALTLALLEGIKGEYIYKKRTSVPLPQHKKGTQVVTLEELSFYAKARVKELVVHGQAVVTRWTDGICLDFIPIATVQPATAKASH